MVEWGAGQMANAARQRGPAPRQKRLLMDVIDAAIDEAGFQFMRFADGPMVRAVKDGTARDRYFARIAEPADGDDPEKAAEPEAEGLVSSVKTALDAKDLMAATKDGERILWKP